ncbi:MAG: hypothetical protein WCI31_17425 [Prolixibacteraceae bacterium]
MYKIFSNLKTLEKLSTYFVSVLTLYAGAAGSGVFSLPAKDPKFKLSVKRMVLASGLFWFI